MIRVFPAAALLGGLTLAAPALATSSRSPERGWIGVTVQPSEPLSPMEPAGARIIRVNPDSAAARSGLRPGDVIESIANIPTPDPRALASAVATKAPGSFVTAKVIRNGRWKTLALTIGAAPTNPPASRPEAQTNGEVIGQHAPQGPLHDYDPKEDRAGVNPDNHFKLVLKLIKKYCASHSGMSCGAFNSAATECWRSTGMVAMQVLQLRITAKDTGMTLRQAAGLIGAPYYLADLPLSVSSRQAQNNALSECLIDALHDGGEDIPSQSR